MRHYWGGVKRNSDRRCAVAMLLWGALQGTARDVRLLEWICCRRSRCAAYWDRARVCASLEPVFCKSGVSAFATRFGVLRKQVLGISNAFRVLFFPRLFQTENATFRKPVSVPLECKSQYFYWSAGVFGVFLASKFKQEFFLAPCKLASL